MMVPSFCWYVVDKPVVCYSSNLLHHLHHCQILTCFSARKVLVPKFYLILKPCAPWNRLVYDSGTDEVAHCLEKTGEPCTSWTDRQRGPPWYRTMRLWWFNCIWQWNSIALKGAYMPYLHGVVALILESMWEQHQNKYQFAQVHPSALCSLRCCALARSTCMFSFS